MWYVLLKCNFLYWRTHDLKVAAVISVWDIHLTPLRPLLPLINGYHKLTGVKSPNSLPFLTRFCWCCQKCRYTSCQTSVPLKPEIYYWFLLEALYGWLSSFSIKFCCLTHPVFKTRCKIFSTQMQCLNPSSPNIFACETEDSSLVSNEGPVLFSLCSFAIEFSCLTRYSNY